MRRLLTVIVLALACHLTPSIASADEAVAAYNAGNAAFNSADFDQAIEQYETARKQGYDDGRLLYNLGCAYLRADNLGEAIRYFEMASLRRPRDGDVRYNLEFARKLREDELPDVEQSLIERIGDGPVKLMTFNELCAAMALCSLAGFVVLIVVWPQRTDPKRRRLIAVGGLLIVLAMAFGGFAVRHHIEFGGHRVVVGADELPVRSGPGLQDATLFTVHEGMDARVREVRGTWSLIEIPTGFTGWAPNEALLPIG